MIDIESDRGDLMLSVKGQTILDEFSARWGVWNSSKVAMNAFEIDDNLSYLPKIKVDFKVDPVNLKLLEIDESNFWENIYKGPGFLAINTIGHTNKIAHHRLVLFGYNHDEIMRIMHTFPYTPLLNRPPEFTGEDYFERNGEKAFTTQRPEPYPVKYPLEKLLKYL